MVKFIRLGINSINKDPILSNNKYFLNDKEIKVDENFKYLGYHIDNKLNFKKHTNYLVNKLSSVSSILTNINKLFSYKYSFL